MVVLKFTKNNTFMFVTCSRLSRNPCWRWTSQN